MKLKLYLLTLIGLGSSLCFGSGRASNMHSSPKRAQLSSPQLRSPSAPRQQSFLKLFAKAQNAHPQAKNPHDDGNVSISNNLQETFKKLAHEILNKHTAILQYKKNVSYSAENLHQFKKELEDFHGQLKKIDISRASQQIRDGYASLMSFLQQDFGAIDEMSNPRTEEALPRRIDSPKPMLISDEFRGNRGNQVKVMSPTPATPVRTHLQRPLAELMQTPPALRPESPKLADASTDESTTQTDEIAPQPAKAAENKMIDSATQTEHEITDPLLHLPRPSFMRRHWKFITICTLFTGGLLIGGQKKYKLLTRLAHIFTK